MYIYIYIERERYAKREKEREPVARTASVHARHLKTSRSSRRRFCRALPGGSFLHVGANPWCESLPLRAKIKRHNKKNEYEKEIRRKRKESPQGFPFTSRDFKTIILVDVYIYIYIYIYTTTHTYWCTYSCVCLCICLVIIISPLTGKIDKSPRQRRRRRRALSPFDYGGALLTMRKYIYIYI